MESLIFSGRRKKYIINASQQNALVFNDWSGRNQMEQQFQTNFVPYYLPVILESGKDQPKCKTIGRDEINLGWLGRLTADKIFSLYNLIDNFEAIQISGKKRLHIIGDGQYYKQIQAYCNSQIKSIEVIMVGTLQKNIPEEQIEEANICPLYQYLSSQVDILFAMGTSVLEGAALGIPSVSVFLDTKRFYENSFSWIFDAKEYCLGVTNQQKNNYDIPCYTLEEIINTVKKDKTALGERCRQYYQKNHSNLTQNMKTLLTFARDTKLTIAQHIKLLKYVPYNAMTITQLKSAGILIGAVIHFANHTYYKLFGITLMEVIEEEKHKMYRPFGLKTMFHTFKKEGYIFRSEQFKG